MLPPPTNNNARPMLAMLRRLECMKAIYEEIKADGAAALEAQEAAQKTDREDDDDYVRSRKRRRRRCGETISTKRVARYYSGVASWRPGRSCATQCPTCATAPATTRRCCSYWCSLASARPSTATSGCCASGPRCNAIGPPPSRRRRRRCHHLLLPLPHQYGQIHNPQGTGWTPCPLDCRRHSWNRRRHHHRRPVAATTTTATTTTTTAIPATPGACPKTPTAAHKEKRTATKETA